MEEEYLTVSQINAYISKKFRSDNNLKNIFIKGEISNYKPHTSGHSYFTLKDEHSQISAVMFKGRKKFLKFEPEDGMKVIIKGSIEVYENTGRYQLYANRMTEDGLGELHIAFEQLKKKLENEGLFEDAHKKKIPKYPKRIGVITAPTGAAIRDIITTISKRYPQGEIIVFPTLVQGNQAAAQIAHKIKLAQTFSLDTIIVGRGGGSIEDLWPFNEEIVARAIYECETPIISGVGHETDTTISDFVADLRAPTPTGAAVNAVPQISEVEYKIEQLTLRLNKNINDKIKENRTKLDQISQRQVLKNPENIYEIKGMHLDNLINKLEFASKSIISENRNKLFRLENKNILRNPNEITKSKKEAFSKNIAKLEVLNPLLTLKRGYTLTKVEGKVVSSAKDIKSGDRLDVEFDDGTVNTKVI